MPHEEAEERLLHPANLAEVGLLLGSRDERLAEAYRAPASPLMCGPRRLARAAEEDAWIDQRRVWVRGRRRRETVEGRTGIGRGRLVIAGGDARA